MEKTKIVLDADVLFHFYRGGLLATLPQIFNDYKHIVLTPVYDELPLEVKNALNNIISLLKTIETVEYNPTGKERLEYFSLKSSFGKGESASMAYCKYHNDVIGSSNLRDIKAYCTDNGITYLTTVDFLYYAIRKSLITVDEANQFIADVKAKGSKLPSVDFSTYLPDSKL